MSVSTLEHVGFDEDVRDPDKPVRALERMVSWLNPGGRCLVTVPLGYNASFDERLWSGALRFDELRFMRRMSRANRWREATAEDVRDVRYGEPFICANAIAVGSRSSAVESSRVRTPPADGRSISRSPRSRPRPPRRPPT